MRRTPEVIDAWFDSGAMPYAQWHYPFEHEAEFNAPFRQTSSAKASIRRAAGSTAARDRDHRVRPLADKHVIVNELVLDPEVRRCRRAAATWWTRGR